MLRSLVRRAGCMVAIGLVTLISLLARQGVAQTNEPSTTATAMSPEEQAKAAKLAKASSVYRDTWGVPHIRGQNDAAVLFAYAYAQAEDNFWQLEDTYILSLGRYCEVQGYFGLNSDLLNRAFEVVPQSKVAYERLEPRMQA